MKNVRPLESKWSFDPILIGKTIGDNFFAVKQCQIVATIDACAQLYTVQYKPSPVPVHTETIVQSPLVAVLKHKLNGGGAVTIHSFLDPDPSIQQPNYTI